MHYPPASISRPAYAPRWTPFAFALGILLVGLAPGALTFALDPDAAARIGSGAVPIAPWVFTVVWLVAYPGMGVATWIVWRRRGEVDVSVPVAVFAVAFLQTLSFWLTNSVQMTAMIDATGVLLACSVAWVYSRYAKAALWWLLPWLVWMPITLAIKLWALFGGAS